MRRTVQRLAAAGAVGGLALAGLAAAPAQADPDSPVVFHSFEVNGGEPVVLGPGSHHAVPMSFDIEDDSGLTAHDTEVHVFASRGYVHTYRYDWHGCVQSSPQRVRCDATVELRDLDNAEAGAMTAVLFVAPDDWDPGQDRAEAEVRFSARREATLSLGTSYSRGALSYGGRLKAADWNGGGYVDLAGQAVQLRYSALPWFGDHVRQTTTTGTYGTVLGYESPAPESGFWRLRYPGSEGVAPASSAWEYHDG